MTMTTINSLTLPKGLVDNTKLGFSLASLAEETAKIKAEQRAEEQRKREEIISLRAVQYTAGATVVGNVDRVLDFASEKMLQEIADDNQFASFAAKFNEVTKRAYPDANILVTIGDIGTRLAHFYFKTDEDAVHFKLRWL